MTPEDFGKIAMVVNEFGNLNGVIGIDMSGMVRIKYEDSDCFQRIDPDELRMVLLLREHEYIEEYAPLKEKRDADQMASWRERNLQSYISHLEHIQHQLSMLATWQSEGREA